MMLASFLFSLMTVSVYAVSLCEPSLPTPMISFVRIGVNLCVLLIPALLGRQVLSLFGDMRISLWMRGLFGTLALLFSFASIQRIGPGESSFLGASSGVFVVLLSPWVLKQKNTVWVWLAVLGSLAGVFFLFAPVSTVNADVLGRVMGLCSGLLSALAYLMVARAGRSNSPQSVIFYFCLVALLVHMAYFAFGGFVWPRASDTWLVMLGGGLAASGAQFYMTRAYQMAPAALVSAVGYLAPVLSLIWGMWLFGRIPEIQALAGCALVLLCGVLLPFLTASSRRVT